MMKIALLSAVLTAYCLNGFAQSSPMNIPSLTTASLNPVCARLLEIEAQERAFDHGLCVGIILGVEDNAHYDKKICVPSNIEIKGRVQAVRDYVATQPNRMNEAFASLVFDAMAEKWPCKN